MTSGSLHGVMLAYWPGMPDIWVSIPAIGTVSPIFITPTTVVAGPGYCGSDTVLYDC